MKEIHRSRGDDCGGDSINDALGIEMIKIFGGPVLIEIKNEHPTLFWEVHREFEAAKKTVDGLHDDDFSIRLPFHILNALFKKKTDEELIEAIQIGPHGSGITLKYDTLFIKQSMVLEKLFQPTKNRILSLLKKIASEVEGSESDSSTKINKILLVGGFSDSKYIQKAVREAFPDKLVITPESADLCVLKGAVIFGHSPELISHRVMRFTYGIRSNATFDCEKHDKERKIIVYKKEYCKDTFLMYVQIGSVVEIDTIITKTLSTMYPYQKEVSFPVCISTASNPIYADVPDCEEIGKLTVEITDPIKELRNFDVSLVFGNTEIQIHAKDSINRKDYKATLDFVLY